MTHFLLLADYRDYRTTFYFGKLAFSNCASFIFIAISIRRDTLLACYHNHFINHISLVSWGSGAASLFWTLNRKDINFYWEMTFSQLRTWLLREEKGPKELYQVTYFIHYGGFGDDNKSFQLRMYFYVIMSLWWFSPTAKKLFCRHRKWLFHCLTWPWHDDDTTNIMVQQMEVTYMFIHCYCSENVKQI